jgi:outer membrane lipoprotein carrier protein
MKQRMTKTVLLGAVLWAAAAIVQAEPVDALRAFVRDVKTGQASFTQTVTSPDGAKKKTSSGHFEFQRPNRFRFTYIKPFEQVIVGDGQKVWIYDADLNQASSRKLGDALGATPAALLAGGNLEKDFELTNLPPNNGLEWAQATPRVKDGAFQALRIGFKGKTLAALEIVDSFGQRSLLQFGELNANTPVPAEVFIFTPPKGAEVIAQ